MRRVDEHVGTIPMHPQTLAVTSKKPEDAQQPTSPGMHEVQDIVARTPPVTPPSMHHVVVLCRSSLEHLIYIVCTLVSAVLPNSIPKVPGSRQ